MTITTADIEQSLAEKIASFVYPSESSSESIFDFDVKIARGWPPAAELNADLTAASPLAWITVNQKSGMTRDKTRYGRGWIPSRTQSDIGITAKTSNGVLQFNGVATASGVAGAVVDDVAYPVYVSIGDTATLVAQKIGAQIREVGRSTIVTTGSSLLNSSARTFYAKISSNISIERELCRIEEGFCISLFAPSIAYRDTLESGVMTALLAGDELLRDVDSGPLKFVKRDAIDSSLNEGLYRLDLIWTFEYGWTETQAVAPTLWPVGVVNDAWAFGVLGTYTPPKAPPIGAIRFDAWYDMTNTIDQQCAVALSDGQWEYRLPANSSIMTDGSVTWPTATQDSIDLEITAALSAGLSFWAFDSYLPSNTLSSALSLYLSSNKRGNLQFCMLGQSSNWGDLSGVDGYSPALHRDIDLMSNDFYFTVLDGRPLYLMLDANSGQLSELPSGISGAVSYIRSRVGHETGKDPYIVYLSGAALQDYDNTTAANSAGADASGAYCTPRLNGATQPYSSLTAAAAADWSARAASGFPMMPTAMAGWDQRPLIKNPQAFYPLDPSLNVEDYYETATPDALADHVASMAEFIQSTSSTTCGAGLLYAWNEFAEGGWIAPTYLASGSNDERVSAVGSAIQKLEQETLYPELPIIT
ncbi:hypothetical protein [Acetobacter sp. DsW_063]|uniref:hypothetical protein n=1 Tax=Acetobacter sp. DsW_063 TaxID=1514894 RepID=UPI001177EA31|nr:hypothetical protein [Acetobacter sp. DsW_063]